MARKITNRERASIEEVSQLREIVIRRVDYNEIEVSFYDINEYGMKNHPEPETRRYRVGTSGGVIRSSETGEGEYRNTRWSSTPDDLENEIMWQLCIPLKTRMVEAEKRMQRI